MTVLLPLLVLAGCTPQGRPTAMLSVSDHVLTAPTAERANNRGASAANTEPDRTATPRETVDGHIVGSGRATISAPVAIVADGVTLLIDSGAVSRDVEISVVATTEEHSGPIPGRLANLTGGGAVYRMLPDGQRFDRDITIAMHYDSTALPRGYTADDIYTFFYNEGTGQWQQVERDSVDTRNGVVYSRTDHFTDYINGVLKEPESSDAMAYTPTSIKELEAADPMEGVTLMAPPEANSQGTAVLSYPLAVPAGRRGMQPRLAVTYSSAGGSGVLGLGWDLPVSEVSVVTSHGVPLFDTMYETEAYALDGEELVTARLDHGVLRYDKPVYRREWQQRDIARDTTVYHPRVEGAFRRIRRIGDRPGRYQWEVTDRDGTRHLYGDSDGTRVTDSRGNIVRWLLSRSTDVYGNTIRYSYDKRLYTRQGLNPGQQAMLSRIDYTGHGDSAGAYNVRLYYTTEGKPDATVSARSGAMEADAWLLDHIDVSYGDAVVRSYFFGYKTGAFGRTLLCNIVEADPVTVSLPGDGDGQMFEEPTHRTHHGLPTVTQHSSVLSGEDLPECGYVDHDVAAASDLYADSGFVTDRAGEPLFQRNPFDRCCTATGKSKYYTYNEHRFEYSSVPSEMLEPATLVVNRTGISDDISGHLFVPGGGSPGALEGTSTRTGNIGGGLDVGFGYNTVFKELTGGGNYSHTASESEGLVTLVDLDGDRLPDKLYKRGGHLRYRLRDNGSPGLFGSERTVTGAGDFLFSRSTGNTFGLEGSAGVGNSFQFGIGWTTDNSTTGTYLADFDGDGRVDLASDGEVYLNRVDRHPARLFIPARGEAVYDTQWHCGYSVIDTFLLGGPVDAGMYEDYDNDTMVYTLCRDSVYYDIHEHPVDTVVCRDTMVVSSYRAPRPYEPGLENVRMWVAPYDGAVLVGGTATAEPSAHGIGDGMDLSIQRDTAVILRQHLSPGATLAVAVPGAVPVTRGTRLFFRVSSGGSRYSDRLEWNPVIRYTVVTTPGAVLADSIGPDGLNRYAYDYGRDFLLGGVQDVMMPYTARVRLTAGLEADAAAPFPSPVAMQVLVDGVVKHTLSVDAATRSLTAMWHDTVQKGSTVRVRLASPGHANWGAVDARCRLTVVGNLSTDPGDSQISCIDTVAIPGDTVFFYDFYPMIQPLVRIHDTVLGGRDTTLYTGNGLYSGYDESYAAFGTMYRHWGQFAYKAADHTGRLDTSLLHLDLLGGLTQADSHLYRALGTSTTVTVSADSPEGTVTLDDRPAYNPLSSPFVMMQADFGRRCWSAYSGFTYTERRLVSNTPVLTADGLAGARGDSVVYLSTAICHSPVARAAGKRSYNRSRSLTASGALSVANVAVLNAGGSLANSWSRQLSDMMDLNGDGLPDALSETKVQYSRPMGGLSAKESRHDIDRTHLDSTATTTIGGSFCGSAFIAKPEPDSKPRKAYFSLSGGVGADIGGTSSVSDGVVSWADLNGDGLPDKTVRVGDDLYYYQNTGYAFMGRRLFAGGSLPRQGYESGLSGGASLSATLSRSWLNEQGQELLEQYNLLDNLTQYLDSFPHVQHCLDSVKDLITERLGDSHFSNKLNVSLTAGMNTAVSQNNNVVTVTDFNGDGLPDMMEKYRGGYVVRFNNGNGFGGGLAVLLLSDTGNVATTTDLSAAVTLGVTIGSIPLKVEGNPKGGLSRTLGSTRATWMDMDGDGVVDYVWDAGGSAIGVRRSRLGEANRLVQVTLPSGGRYRMGYALNDDGPESNGHHYVLDSLAVSDRRMAAPDRRFRFLYSDRHYDRVERDDYGYAEVVTVEDSVAGDGYRRTVRRYHNRDRLFRGLCCLTAVVDGRTGDTLTARHTEYRLFESATGDLIQDLHPGCQGDGFPAVLTDSVLRYDSGQPRIVERVGFEYTRFGNVATVDDEGDLADPDDDYTLYTVYDSVGDHVVSAVTEETVFHGHDRYRHRSAVVDGRTGDILTLTFHNNGFSDAVYDFRRDFFGNLDSVIHPENHRGQRYFVTYKYDNETHTLPVAVTNAHGLSSTVAYDHRWQRPLQTVSANGAQTEYRYDSHGRLEELYAPFEYGSGHATIRHEYYDRHPHTFAYWDTCRMWARTLSLNGGTDYIAAVTLCDGLGRPRMVKREASVEGHPMRVVGGYMELDALGRVAREYYPDMEPLSSPDSAVNFQFATLFTQYDHDRLDRVVRTVHPDNTVDRAAHSIGSDPDGRLRLMTLATDANGHVSRLFSDVHGRTAAVVDPLGATTRFRYDPAGLLVKSKGPEGDSTLHVYDMLGRRTDRHHPSAGHTRWDYDPAGNLVSMTANSGERVEYRYTYTRLDSVCYPDRPWNDALYRYGIADGSADAGRLVFLQDATGVQEFRHDAMGNVVYNRHSYVQPHSADAFSLVTRWGYDSWGRVDSVVYPDGERVRYHYDAGGALLSVDGYKPGHVGPTTYIEKVFYDRFGQRTSVLDGDGVKTTYDYELDTRRLSQLTSISLNTSETLQDVTYKYDNVGNITEIRDYGRNPRDQYYSYDAADRLTKSIGSMPQEHTTSLPFSYETSYTYSLGGRLTRKRVDSRRLSTAMGSHLVRYDNVYHYDILGNPFAVSHVHDNENGVDRELCWDDNGNLVKAISDGSNRYLCWTEDNRLQAFLEQGEQGNIAAWYNYSASGERNFKLASPRMSLQQNAEPFGNPPLVYPTLYASPLVTLTKHGYTKHYFEEGRRICSKIGGGLLGNVPAEDIEQLSPALADDYPVLYDRQRTGVVQTFRSCLGADPLLEDDVNFRSLLVEHETQRDDDEPAFFYHSDHLGSAAYLTSNGNVVQTLNYLPYGEDWVERNYFSPSDTTRLGIYRFNGKEKDYESGFHYYGARYYWSELLTGWLSVDPMMDKYPSISPYAYCAWNPVKLVDPNGMDVSDDWYINANGEVKWSDDVHSEADLKKGEIYIGRTAFMTILNGDNVCYGDSEGKIHDVTTLREISVKTDRTEQEKNMANPIVQSIYQAQNDFWGAALNIGLETGEQTFSYCGLGLQTIGYYCMVVPGGQLIGAEMYSIGKVVSDIGLGFSLLNDIRHKDKAGFVLDIVSWTVPKGTAKLIDNGVSSGFFTYTTNDVILLKSFISTRTGIIIEATKKAKNDEISH